VSAFTSYETNLDEILETVSFYRAAFALRAGLAAQIRRDNNNDFVGLVDAFLRKAVREERIHQAFLLVAHAGFEHFVLALHEDACELVNQARIGPAELERRLPGFARKYQRVAGSALAQIFEPRDYWRLDYARLIEAIGSTGPRSEITQLMSRIFVIDASPVDSEGLRKKLSSFGYAMNWDNFGRKPEVARLLGTSGVRETAKNAKDQLDIQCGWRNTLAHSHGELILTQHDFDKSLSFYRYLAQFLSEEFIRTIRQTLA